MNFTNFESKIAWDEWGTGMDWGQEWNFEPTWGKGKGKSTGRPFAGGALGGSPPLGHVLGADSVRKPANDGDSSSSSSDEDNEHRESVNKMPDLEPEVEQGLGYQEGFQGHGYGQSQSFAPGYGTAAGAVADHEREMQEKMARLNQISQTNSDDIDFNDI